MSRSQSPLEAPAYRHAGNRADVWKHVILSCVVFRLAGRDAKGTFRYFETHCGGPAYRLPARGEWRAGVARALPGRGDPALPGLCYFDQFGAGLGSNGSRVGAGSLYLSSWMQVSQLLQRWGRPYELRLCDTSPEVAAQIEPMGIDFVAGDGFAELDRDPTRYTLILVDPPYGDDHSEDWERVAAAVGTLRLAEVQFLVWYPVYSEHTRRRVQELIDTTLSHSVELVWNELDDGPGHTLKGCGMLFGEVTSQLLDLGDGWGAVAEKLGGRYERRAGTGSRLP